MAYALMASALAAGSLLHPQGAAAATLPGPSATAAAVTACRPGPPVGGVMRLGGIARKLQGLMPIRILAIGSSSTQGIGASSPAHSYPARLEAELKARWPKDQPTVVNAGIGGETVAATVDRLERQLAAQRFDLVIWQLGTNDAIAGDDPEAFRLLVLRGIAAARAAGVDLVLLDPQYFPGIRDLARYERFVAIIKAIGEDAHVPVFRRYAMMKQWSAQGSDLLAALSPDHFHMNDAGYGCLAQALTSEIGKMTDSSAVADEPPVAVSAAK
jgi:acyl-CoA thioesterase I